MCVGGEGWSGVSRFLEEQTYGSTQKYGHWHFSQLGGCQVTSGDFGLAKAEQKAGHGGREKGCMHGERCNGF